MPLYTFYAEPSDAAIESTSATYATAREGTGTVTPGSTSAVTLPVGQKLVTGTYTVTQSFLSFDTHTLPRDRVLVGATFTMGVSSDVSTTDFTIELRAHDWGTTLEAADFVAGSALSGKTLVASLGTTTPLGAGSVQLFADLDTILDAVNPDGATRFFLSSSRQRTGTAPTGNEYVDFRSNDFGVTLLKPTLNLNMTPAMRAEIGTNNTKTTGTTIAITTTKAVTAGQSIVVALAMDPAAGTVSATDSAGNTYVVADQATNGSGTSGARIVMLAAHNAAAMAAGSTITVTHPSCAARAVAACTLAFDGVGTKVTSANATGTGTAPAVTVKSPVLQPMVIAAVAIEGPFSDTYTEDAGFVAMTGTGNDAGGATTNITLRWCRRSPMDATEHIHNPTMGTSRLWATASVVFDATDAQIRTFVEDEGLRTSSTPGDPVVDSKLSFNPSTGFATELRATVNDPALTIYYGCVIGATTYGGEMTYGETIVSLPGSTVGVVIDADANVEFTGLDGDLELRVPA